MSKHLGYPTLNIKSKYELADLISDRSLPYAQAVELITKMIRHHEEHWRDNRRESKPDENKFVRSANRATLGKLLKKIDQKILAPYDSLIPSFIYGGISGRSHVQANRRLLGWKRGRTILKLDIKRFFEQIPDKRVFQFFNKKCGSSVEVSKILALLCCVPEGAKGSGSSDRVLGRGFATSTRLAVWCNIDTFYHLKWKAHQLLKAHDPEMAVFIDDIGVSGSRVTKSAMENVSDKLEGILIQDVTQKLPINDKKKLIAPFKNRPEHLGVELGRNSLTESRAVRAKISRIKAALRNKDLSTLERHKLIEKRKHLYRYKAYVRRNVAS